MMPQAACERGWELETSFNLCGSLEGAALCIDMAFVWCRFCSAYCMSLNRPFIISALVLVGCSSTAAVYDGAPAPARKKDSGAVAPAPGEEGATTEDGPPQEDEDAGQPVDMTGVDAGKPKPDGGGKVVADSGGPGVGGAGCQSVTLGRLVSDGTCVQRRSDQSWWRCDNGLWTASTATSDPNCLSRFPL
jgi:hypothetical protein